MKPCWSCEREIPLEYHYVAGIEYRKVKCHCCKHNHRHDECERNCPCGDAIVQ